MFEQYTYRDIDYRLPPLHANPNTVTSAGGSSGAFWSVNLQVTMPELIKGVGLIQGGSYYTAGIWNQFTKNKFREAGPEEIARVGIE
jgi:hypothetical protein